MDLASSRCSLRKGFVLLVSLLTCGICQDSGQISFNPNSLVGLKGEKSTLPFQNGPKDALEYSWYRGEDDANTSKIISYLPPSTWETGPAFTGRENVTKKGYLEISNTALSDTGHYTVKVRTNSGPQQATGWFTVGELDDPPVVKANATHVAEHLDPIEAICHTNATKITWYVSGDKVSSNDRMTVSQDGKTLIIRKVDRYDFMVYCSIETFLGLELRSNIISLDVAYGPDSVWLKSKPIAMGNVISADIGSTVEILCDATSTPKSTYHWIHNGSLLPASKAQITFSRLSWEQMGRYRCIVENNTTQLRMYTDVRIKASLSSLVPRDFTLSGVLEPILVVVACVGGGYGLGILVYTLYTYCSNSYVKVFLTDSVLPEAHHLENPVEQIYFLPVAII